MTDDSFSMMGKNIWMKISELRKGTRQCAHYTSIFVKWRKRKHDFFSCTCIKYVWKETQENNYIVCLWKWKLNGTKCVSTVNKIERCKLNNIYLYAPCMLSIVFEFWNTNMCYLLKKKKKRKRAHYIQGNKNKDSRLFIRKKKIVQARKQWMDTF